MEYCRNVIRETSLHAVKIRSQFSTTKEIAIAKSTSAGNYTSAGKRYPESELHLCYNIYSVFVTERCVATGPDTTHLYDKPIDIPLYMNTYEAFCVTCTQEAFIVSLAPMLGLKQNNCDGRLQIQVCFKL